MDPRAQKVAENHGLCEREDDLNCKAGVITNPNVSAFEPFPVSVSVTSYL